MVILDWACGIHTFCSLTHTHSDLFWHSIAEHGTSFQDEIIIMCSVLEIIACQMTYFSLPRPHKYLSKNVNVNRQHHSSQVE